MADEKRAVETEIVVAAETAPAAQKSLGRPMLMLLGLIGAALVGIGIMMFVLSK